mmetsp:Transcript_45209/g.72223  ORF Transcript_45209/g.72223 Transcript_45209/m.72223 type:complete len:238 (-) Transcript_45209:391-1104(-)
MKNVKPYKMEDTQKKVSNHVYIVNLYTVYTRTQKIDRDGVCSSKHTFPLIYIIVDSDNFVFVAILTVIVDIALCDGMLRLVLLVLDITNRFDLFGVQHKARFAIVISSDVVCHVSVTHNSYAHSQDLIRFKRQLQFDQHQQRIAVLAPFVIVVVSAVVYLLVIGQLLVIIEELQDIWPILVFLDQQQKRVGARMIPQMQAPRLGQNDRDNGRIFDVDHFHSVLDTIIFVLVCMCVSV